MHPRQRLGNRALSKFGASENFDLHGATASLARLAPNLVATMGALLNELRNSLLGRVAFDVDAPYALSIDVPARAVNRQDDSPESYGPSTLSAGPALH